MKVCYHKFYVGQEFSTTSEIKESVRQHAIETRRDLKPVKNDLKRVRVRCFGGGGGVANGKPVSPWTLHASQGRNHDTLIVKTLHEEHTCQQKRNLKQLSSTFISKQIGVILVADPDLKACAIQEIMTTKYELGVKKMASYKAKSKAKKGQYEGKLLTAVGVDPNNGIFPLAYAIVVAESSDSWRWFLKGLGDDLDLDSNSNYTFISDRQKGLIPAMARIYPQAEHRYCMRHIYENMRGQFKEPLIKDLVWKCATRTTREEFNETMEELKKSHFSSRSVCDMLLNNVCEIFKSKLVDERDKAVITCLEYVIAKSPSPLTPTTTRIFEKIKKATWNGGDRFQVMDDFLDKQVVDQRTKTCTCRKWELTGFPCKHAVASIWNMSDNSEYVGELEDWVNPVYKLKTWSEVYSFKVEQITGFVSWP
ncbi:uncharacterized protein [Rutidosis leptorrhynchoides]|uniref:uncharacterized protein n=1 Tax=Rutidosis leptorrhynchoides TaxID=125765 RepID=UPI003A99984A